MTKRKQLTRLTIEQTARMSSWVQEWIARGWCTDEADWEAFERGARECYGFADLPWHNNIVRVSNPLVGALSAPIAAYLLCGDRAVHSAVDSTVGSAVRSAVRSAVHSAVHSAVRSAVRPAVDSAVRPAVYSAVDSAVDSAVRSAVRPAVDSAVHSAVDSAVRSAVDSAVESAVLSAVRSAVRPAVGSPVDSAVGLAVESAVGSTVGSAVRSAVDSAVDSAVGLAVRLAVHSAVDSAVGSAVQSAIGSAVYSAVDAATLKQTIDRLWNLRLGGGHWLSWQAYTSFFRDVCEVDLPGDLWERDRAYALAQQSAGWWWPHRQFLMVSDRPSVLHVDQFSPGRYRLHCDTGPSIAYRDGWALYYLEGVRVEPHVVERPNEITIQEIRELRNPEVRRVVMQQYGLLRYFRDLGAKALDSRFGEALFRDPHDGNKWLVCTDGSTGRIYQLRVPTDVESVLQAQAALNGVDPALMLARS